VLKRRGHTLLEILLVISLLAVLAGLPMPALLRELSEARLPESCRQMRSLIQLTRANAMIDGLRYRIRFPREDEIDGEGGQRQPIVEVERDPLFNPEIFEPVLAAWAREPVLEDEVRCAQVRLGRPTVEMMLNETEDEEEAFVEQMEEEMGERFEEGFPPLVFEPDGTCEWATFVITDAPADVHPEDLEPEEDAIIEIIVDGLSGLAWLQRRFYEDELAMMRDNGWPPVLRKDFLDPVPLTEDDVLEIRETRIRKQ